MFAQSEGAMAKMAQLQQQNGCVALQLALLI
jgi:hypothetical protein